MKQSRKSSAPQPGEYSLRVKKLRGALSQGDFAKSLGVEQPAVSAFERGAYEPTPEVYLRLGMLAAGKDRKWFWAKVDSAIERVPPIAAQILNQRSEPPAPSEIYRIPPMREFLGEAPDLIFPDSAVPNRAATKYVRVTDPTMQPMTSETDLRKLEGSCVALFKRSNPLVSEERKRDAAEAAKFIEVHNFDPLHEGIFAGWLGRRLVGGYSGATPAESPVELVAVGPIRGGAPVAVPLAVFRGDRVLHRSVARVLGRVIAWSRSGAGSGVKSKGKR